MKDEKKAPKLRFKGFTDDWEQVKLSKTSRSYSGGTPKVGVHEYYDGQIPFIRSGEIASKSTELTISKVGLNNSSAKLVSKGDILYALYGATSGEVSLSKINGAINQAILAIKPIDGYENYFLMTWLQKEKEQITRTYLQGGQGNLSAKIVMNLVVNIPSLSEQSQIAQIFSKLDKTITLHEEKKRQLERLKSALLQKMFADKSGYPAVRFEGFSDEWEQAKFGEITKKYKIRNKQGRILKSFSVSNSNGFVPQELQFENGGYALNSDKTNSIIVKPNSFAYNPARINVGSIGYYNGDKDILVSSLYEVFTLREEFDSKYMWYWIKSNNFDRWIYRLQEGSVRSYFYYDKFSEIKEVLPTLDEQKKIGQLLSKLDSVINVHDRALYLLKMIKQSLLQKMFI
ncbi:restriction endonuclease subunit S [Lactobacillus porci]|uniref:Restriction endonuclease subunit S n=1 Tax=Lactobacillus porci TaxID=2012477 RepID=A0A6A8MGJ4_9LACO|nr:restriction endonuclease subunit S [Lactobacillus porci]MST87898.1 restriction endonuclease subunit S [Lactobacillus porci]